MIKLCPTCADGTLSDGLTTHTRPVGALTFRATVPAEVCDCGEAIVTGSTMQLFNLHVCQWLTDHGMAKAEHVKLIRKTLDLSQPSLAYRLLVSQETLCRWENNKRPISAHAYFTLAAMVNDALTGSDVVRRTRRAWGHPSTLDGASQPVTLSDLTPDDVRQHKRPAAGLNGWRPTATSNPTT